MSPLLRLSAILLCLAVSACGSLNDGPKSSSRSLTTGVITESYAQSKRYVLRSQAERAGLFLQNPSLIVWSWLEIENADPTARPLPSLPASTEACDSGSIETSSIQDTDQDGIPALARRSFNSCRNTEIGLEVMNQGYIEISDKDDHDPNSGWLYQQERQISFNNETSIYNQRFEVSPVSGHYDISFGSHQQNPQTAQDLSIAGTYKLDDTNHPAIGGTLSFSGLLEENLNRLEIIGDNLHLSLGCRVNPYTAGAVHYNDGENSLAITYSDCGQINYLRNNILQKYL